MRIAVCDDSIIERSSFYEMLVRYCTAHSIEAGIELFGNGEDFLSSSPSGKYAIILMDVFLKGISGMDTIHELRKTDTDAIVIFCSSTAEHAIEGYSVQATNYLLKPVSYVRLSEALDACQELMLENTRTLTVISDRLPIPILHKSITYIEVMNSTCTIHTSNMTVSTYRSLGDLELELPSPPFLRCHRSYLLNMNHVDVPLERDFRLKDGSLIPISKKEKTKIKQQYFQYLWNQN